MFLKRSSQNWLNDSTLLSKMAAKAKIKKMFKQQLILNRLSLKLIHPNVSHNALFKGYAALRWTKWLPQQIRGLFNIIASSFITFFTYMLRQNVIPYWEELFVAFKMAPNIKKYSLYFSSYRPLYKGHSCILKCFLANCNARFGTCADIVSYLCKF